MDRYYTIHDFPKAGEDTLIDESYSIPGGSCLNAGMVLQNLGDHPYITSCIGQGGVGRKLLDFWEQNGLPADCLMESTGGEDTGYSLVMVDGRGERTFFTHRGCESVFTTEMIPAQVMNEIDFIYLTGYFLLNSSSVSDLLMVLKDLKEKGVPLLFDPGPLCGKIEKEMLVQILSLADWTTPNRGEVEAMAGVLELEQPVDLIPWLHQNGCPHVVIKEGSRGSYLHLATDTFFSPPFKVEAVDTTGAGDSFAAGIIHGQIHNQDLATTLKIASACGAMAATAPGPRVSFGWTNIEAMLRL